MKMRTVFVVNIDGCPVTYLMAREGAVVLQPGIGVNLTNYETGPDAPEETKVKAISASTLNMDVDVVRGTVTYNFDLFPADADDRNVMQRSLRLAGYEVLG